MIEPEIKSPMNGLFSGRRRSRLSLSVSPSVVPSVVGDYGLRGWGKVFDDRPDASVGV